MLVKNPPRYSFLKCAPPRIERFFGPLIQQKDKLLLQWPPSVTGGQNNSCVTQKQTNGGHGETAGAILLPPNNHGMLRLRARAPGGKALRENDGCWNQTACRKHAAFSWTRDIRNAVSQYAPETNIHIPHNPLLICVRMQSRTQKTYG